jgi:hypothetical protein
VVEAIAPAYKEWRATVDVPRDGSQVAVTVPALEPFPAERANPAAPAIPLTAPPPSPPPAETPSHANTQGIVGLVVLGAGVVGLGISGGLALVANGKKQDSLNDCQTGMPNRCDQHGVDLRNQAISNGDAATVAFAVGAAALVTGGVLWLTAPRGTSPHAAAQIALVPVFGGAAVEGTWP